MRFPGFHGEWEITNFRDAFDIKNGLNKDKASFGHGIKIINYKDVNKNRVLDGSVMEGLVNVNEKEMESFNVLEGDIFFTRTSETKDEIALSSAVKNVNENMVFSGFLLRARKKIHLNSIFCSYMFSSPSFRNELIKRSSITTRALIGGNKIYEINFPVPSINEQDKIAKFISLIDEKIETQSKIIEKYKSLMTSIKDNIFKNLDKNYSRVPISNIVQEFTEKITYENEYEILSSTISGIYFQKDYFNKETIGGSTIGYKVVPFGYCTYRSMSDTGKFTFNIQNITEKGIISPAYPVFKSNQYNNQFIIDYLNNSKIVSKSIIALKAGGTRFALPFSKFTTLSIPKIDIAKQNDIVTAINAFTEKLTCEYKVLELLDLQKQNLLKMMFI